MSAAARLSSLFDGYAVVSPSVDVQVTGVALDSRQVKRGDLFLACAGAKSHGLAWLADAVSNGAVAIAWDPAGWDGTPSFPVGVSAVQVSDLHAIVGRIAARFHGNPSHSVPVLGVTGTNGKTSVTHLLAEALSASGQPCGLLGTLGYGLHGNLQRPTHTTPDATRIHALLAAMRDQGAGAVAMEVSSHALQQDRVAGVRFRAAVFTNLTRDHLDYHGDFEAYGEAKRRLFESEGLEAAIIAVDDAFGRELMQSLPAGVRSTVVGDETVVGTAERFVAITEVHPHPSGMDISLETHAGPACIKTQLLGRFNATNLALATGALLEIGLKLDDVVRFLAASRTVPGRMEAFHGDATHPVVVVDYAHTPDALEQVLKSARDHTHGRLVCVFGCGGDRDRGKRPMMAAVAASWADECIVTDDNPRNEDAAAITNDIIEGFPSAARWRVEHDRGRAIAEAIADTTVGDVVVIAGKGHEDYQLVGDRVLPFSDRDAVMSILQGGAA